MQTPATVSRTTLEVYDDLGPWAAADASYALLTFLDAITSQHDVTEQYTRDDPTHTGWGQLLDVNACPDVALPWLAQFAGVVVPVGVTGDALRALIRGQANTARGTVATMMAVAQSFLTAPQRVDFLERTPDPYSFTVRVYSAEAGDAANQTALRNALIAAKPAGLIMTVVVQTGPTIDQLVGTINAQNPAPTGAIDDYASEVPV